MTETVMAICEKGYNINPVKTSGDLKKQAIKAELDLTGLPHRETHLWLRTHVAFSYDSKEAAIAEVVRDFCNHAKCSDNGCVMKRLYGDPKHAVIKQEPFNNNIV